MAFCGHEAAHVPQPWHSASITLAFMPPFSPGTSSGAPYGQSSVHSPQPTHSSLSTTAESGSIQTFFANMGAAADDAAAFAWATLSGMSLGLWQHPARYMPSIAVSTGLSFGCASAKNPSALTVRLSTFPILSLPADGISPVESTP